MKVRQKFNLIFSNLKFNVSSHILFCHNFVSIIVFVCQFHPIIFGDMLSKVSELNQFKKKSQHNLEQLWNCLFYFLVAETQFPECINYSRGLFCREVCGDFGPQSMVSKARQMAGKSGRGETAQKDVKEGRLILSGYTPSDHLLQSDFTSNMSTFSCKLISGLVHR